MAASKEINADSYHKGIINVKCSLVQKANELWTCYALLQCVLIEGVQSKAILNTSVGGTS